MNFFHIIFYAMLGVSFVASRRRPNNNNDNNGDDVVDTDDNVVDTEATSSSPSLTEYLSAKEFLTGKFESGELPIPVTVRLGE